METYTFISQFKENNGRLPSQVELTKELGLSPQLAIKALLRHASQSSFTAVPEKTPELSKTVPIKDHTQTFLWVFLSLLAGMAFILSVYFTALWFIGKFHWFISGLISVSMVLFMVVSPSTLPYVRSWFIKAVVGVSFLVAMGFSMASTLAGQYNMTTEKYEAVPNKAAVYDQLLDTEEELLQLITEAQRDKAIHQNTIEMLSESKESRLDNWQSIATERKQIERYDTRIDGLREELKEIRTREVENGIIEEERDFYLFISELTGLERSFVEFLISAMPSVFIDIVAALCFYLATIIRKEKICFSVER